MFANWSTKNYGGRNYGKSDKMIKFDKIYSCSVEINTYICCNFSYCFCSFNTLQKAMNFVKDNKVEWNFLKFKTRKVEEEDETVKKKRKIDNSHYLKDKITSLLNRVSPPKTFKKNNETYNEMVSDEIPTDKEVIHFGNKVTKVLEDNPNWGPIGMGTEAHKFFQNVFEEIIRQVIIDFPELGKILLQIRNHYRAELRNYQQLYDFSFGYSARKDIMLRTDEVLHELERETEELLERQKKAGEDVHRMSEEFLDKKEEYDHIGLDHFDYYNQINFYNSYIESLLAYFKIHGTELKRSIREAKGKDMNDGESTEEAEQEVEEERTSESFINVSQLEEEEEVPKIPEDDREVKVEVSKPKEEVDKDLIYRGNEDEVVVTDSTTSKDQSVTAGSIESTDEIISPSETDHIEQLKQMEQLKDTTTYSDLEIGYNKRAYEAYSEEKKREEYLRLEEERKMIEQKRQEEKITNESIKSEEEEQEKLKSLQEKMNEEEQGEEEEEAEKESIMEGESVGEESLFSQFRCTSYRDAEMLRFSEIIQAKDDANAFDFEVEPKYSHLKRFATSVKCEDLIQKIPEPKAIEKKKKKIWVPKKSFEKETEVIETPTETQQLKSEEKQLMETELQSGEPLCVILGIKDPPAVDEAPLSDEEDMDAGPARSDDDFSSSGLSMGRTESGNPILSESKSDFSDTEESIEQGSKTSKINEEDKKKAGEDMNKKQQKAEKIVEEEEEEEEEEDDIIKICLT